MYTEHVVRGYKFTAMLVEMHFYKHTRINCDVDELSVALGGDLATSLNSNMNPLEIVADRSNKRMMQGITPGSNDACTCFNIIIRGRLL